MSRKPRESETSFQSWVLALARLTGWQVAHFRSVRVQLAGGRVRYMTPVQADGAGYPDLHMVRGVRSVFAELKDQYKKPSPEQEVWMEKLRATGHEVYLWRPSDRDAIEEVLR